MAHRRGRRRRRVPSPALRGLAAVARGGLAHVERFRRETQERLDVYRRIEPTNSRTGADLFHWFELRRAIERAEQDVAWAGWVLEQIEEGEEASGVVVASLVVLLAPAGGSLAAAPDAGREVMELASTMERLHPDLYASTPRARFRAEATALARRAPTLDRPELVVGLMRLVALAGRGTGTRRSICTTGTPGRSTSTR